MGFEDARTPRRDSVSIPGAATQQAARSTVSFLDLPGGVRRDVYRRVLAVGHPIYLFQDLACRIETFAPDAPRRWLALLHANRRVNSEARAVLYSQNHFHLMDEQPQRQRDALLRSFVGCIGPPSAALLSRLCIGFPVVEEARGRSADAVAIREDSLRSLATLRQDFTGLATLEMLLSHQNPGFLAKAGHGVDPHTAQEALLRINAQIQAIPSVQKVVVRLTIRDLSPRIVDMMQNLGWLVLNR